jgi:hypothetical protein
MTMVRMTSRSHRCAMGRAIITVLLAYLLLSASTGCTLIGLGAGAATSKTHRYGDDDTGMPAGQALVRAADDDNVEYGDRISVDMIGPPRDIVAGRFEAVDARSVGILRDHRIEVVALDQIREARVQHGTYWLEGMLIGLGVDTLASLAAFGIIASSIGHIR